jgi:Xaa-Pro aminopeptidase
VYPHQAERLTQALDRAGVGALVATAGQNVAYITGFRSFPPTLYRAMEFAVFTTRGTALVVDVADVPGIISESIAVDHLVCYGASSASLGEPASEESRRTRSIVAGAAEDPADALAAALASLDVRDGVVGMDESRLTHDGWQRLNDRLGAVKLVAGAAHLADARRVKGPYEIDCLGHALRRAEEALDAVIQTLERGVTEREAATLYATEVLKRGAWPWPAMISMGEGTAIPASWPTDRALRLGDLVRLDVGCAYKGYQGTVGRTAVLGEPTPAQETAYQAIQGGLDAAIAAVAPGVPGRRVFHSAVAAARANGLAHYQPRRVGYGLGLDPCEAPALTTGREAVFQKGEAVLELGEVLAIETPYEELGRMGMTVKNTVLVTSAGARVLNRSHHGLVILD